MTALTAPAVTAIAERAASRAAQDARLRYLSRLDDQRMQLLRAAPFASDDLRDVLATLLTGTVPQACASILAAAITEAAARREPHDAQSAHRQADLLELARLVRLAGEGAP